MKTLEEMFRAGVPKPPDETDSEALLAVAIWLDECDDIVANTDREVQADLRRIAFRIDKLGVGS